MSNWLAGIGAVVVTAALLFGLYEDRSKRLTATEERSTATTADHQCASIVVRVWWADVQDKEQLDLAFQSVAKTFTGSDFRERPREVIGMLREEMNEIPTLAKARLLNPQLRIETCD